MRGRSGPKLLLGRSQGYSRPNPELARCVWVPAGLCPPRVRFLPPQSRTRRDRRRLLRSLAGHPPSAPHLSLQDPRERSHGSRCWGPARIGLGASLGLSPAAPGSQPLRGGGLRPGSFGPRWVSSRSCSFLLSLHLLRFLNLFGAKSKFVFVHFCETSCRLF